MNTSGDDRALSGDPVTDQTVNADQAPLNWTDFDGRNWRIQLAPQQIALRSGQDAIVLPHASWTGDIFVTAHGDGFVIRVETFDLALRFVVTRKQASPFLAHLGTSHVSRTASASSDETAEREVPLLWPKVSPLAVWALMTSGLVFLPVVGLLPALVTVVLLTLHRRRVRRVPAWRHSRSLCAAALVFLVAGLLVSALSAWGLYHNVASLGVESVSSRPVAGGRNWGVIAGAIVVILLSLSVHEAAHAVTAWWVGDGLARSLGRVTLNPLAHIDPFGTVLLPLILAWAGGPVFGYARPVPVRVESLRRHRRAHILIAIAGPGSNLLLAAASLMLLITAGCLLRLAFPEASVMGFSALDFSAPVRASGFVLAPVFGALCTILKLSFIINAVLAMFNLIPIPPLDGSWVLEHMFPGTLGWLYATIRPYGFLIFLAAIYTDAFDYLLLPVAAILVPGLLLLAGATGL
jgi:Zn-dependent protease